MESVWVASLIAFPSGLVLDCIARYIRRGAVASLKRDMASEVLGRVRMAAILERFAGLAIVTPIEIGFCSEYEYSSWARGACIAATNAMLFSMGFNLRWHRRYYLPTTEESARELLAERGQ